MAIGRSRASGWRARSVPSGSRPIWSTTRASAPRVNAMEDFALFAQPNRLRAVEAAVRAVPAQNDPRRTGRAARNRHDADRRHAQSTRRRKPEPAAPRPAHRRTQSGESALLETAEGYRRIQVGDEIPDIGKIIAIRRMSDYWIVVASLRSLAQAAPPEAAREIVFRVAGARRRGSPPASRARVAPGRARA